MKDFVVKSGDNVYDFKVIPYIRVKSPKVEKNGNVITATFSLEAGKQEVKLKEIQLFAFSDMWVGNNVKLTLNGGTDKQVFSPSTAINSADIYTSGHFEVTIRLYNRQLQTGKMIDLLDISAQSEGCGTEKVPLGRLFQPLVG